MVEYLSLEAALGGRELDRPEEVGGSGEVRSSSVDLVNDILDTGDSQRSKTLLHDGVGGDGDSLSRVLAVSPLVDDVLDGLEVGVSVGDEGLDHAQHLRGCGIDSDEDAVVKLS